MNKIDIYTSNTCPYCTKAKKLLSMLNLEYTEHNVDNNFEEMCHALSQKYKIPCISTVPQIIVNENYVGGYDNLEAMYKNKKLYEILN